MKPNLRAKIKYIGTLLLSHTYIRTDPRQTINQALQELEKQGVLKVAFRKIEILDLALLHRIAHTIAIDELK